MQDENNIKRKSPARISIALMLIMLLWIASGNTSTEKKVSISKASTASDITYVEIRKSVAKKKIKEIEMYGVTDYSRKANLRAEIFGRIVGIESKEGNNIKKDSIILNIEKRDRYAKFLEATSNVKEKNIAYEAARGLEEKGYQAKTGLAKASADLEKAKAILIQAKIDMENTHVKAPFDGYLESVLVEKGTYVGPNVRIGQGSFNDGDTIAIVVDRSPMLVTGYVSEKYISSVKIGTIVSVDLISGEQIDGKISYISSIADTITRTFKIEVTIDNEKDINYKSGVTALVRIPISHDRVHSLKPSALVLGDKDELGIKVLESANNSQQKLEDQQIKGIVKFKEVTIYDTSPEYVYVSGLPENINVITLGHGFVHDGQKGVIGAISDNKSIN